MIDYVEEWKKVKSRHKALADTSKFKPDIAPVFANLKTNMEKNKALGSKLQGAEIAKNYNALIKKFNDMTITVRNEQASLDEDWIDRDAKFGQRIQQAIGDGADASDLFAQFEKGWDENVKLRRVVDEKFYKIQGQRSATVMQYLNQVLGQQKANWAEISKLVATRDKLKDAARRLLLDYEKTALRLSEDDLAKELRALRNKDWMQSL